MRSGLRSICKLLLCLFTLPYHFACLGRKTKERAFKKDTDSVRTFPIPFVSQCIRGFKKHFSLFQTWRKTVRDIYVFVLGKNFLRRTFFAVSYKSSISHYGYCRQHFSSYLLLFFLSKTFFFFGSSVGCEISVVKVQRQTLCVYS